MVEVKAATDLKALGKLTLTKNKAQALNFVLFATVKQFHNVAGYLLFF